MLKATILLLPLLASLPIIGIRDNGQEHIDRLQDEVHALRQQLAVKDALARDFIRDMRSIVDKEQKHLQAADEHLDTAQRHLSNAQKEVEQLDKDLEQLKKHKEQDAKLLRALGVIGSGCALYAWYPELDNAFSKLKERMLFSWLKKHKVLAVTAGALMGGVVGIALEHALSA